MAGAHTHSTFILFIASGAKSNFPQRWRLIDGTATGVCESKCVCVGVCTRSSQLACVHDELLMLALSLSLSLSPTLLSYYSITFLPYHDADAIASCCAVNKQNGRDKSHVCAYLAAIFYPYILVFSSIFLAVK